MSGRVAIVVLSHERRDDLLACLASVARLEDAERDVLVFDNASSDGSADAVEALGDAVAVERSDRNLGAPVGRNAAVSRLRERFDGRSYDAILFLDDDARVDPGFLAQAHRALTRAPDVGIVCGRAFTAFPSTTLLTVGTQIDLGSGRIRDLGEGEEDRGQYAEPREIDAGASFAMLVRFELFERLGGFDERYSPYGFEDFDLCLRARKLGWRTLYEPAALVHHKGCRFGRGPIARYERAKARNYLRLVYSHGSPLERVQFTLRLPWRAAAAALRLARSGDVRSIIAQVRGLADSLGRARGD